MEYALLLVWLALYQALALVGLPVASLLFRGFPDRGAAFALPVSLTILTLVAYWVGHVRFGVVAVAAAVVVLLATSALAVRRGFEVRWGRHAEAMAVFTLAFLLLVAIRAVDPAAHAAGGEKFLDFGLLQSILRTDALPPEDMWFAGRAVRYYYGGFLMTGTLAQLVDTPARYAYNLALAGFYATLVTAAYGLAGAVAASRGRSARAGGILGAFLVGFAGNLATPGRMLLGLLPRDLAAKSGHFLLGGIRAPYEELLDSATAPSEFNYWVGRYVIPDTLNVFPMWSFLNGDLNAYMIATPFLLLAAALCFAYYRTPATAVWRRRLLVFGAIPGVAGLLALVSTWSFPTVCGLAWLSLVFADADPATLFPDVISRRLGSGSVEAATDGSGGRSIGNELRRMAAATVQTGIVGVLGAALVFPFLLFHSSANEGVGFLPPRSGFGGLVLVHGAFLTIFALHLGSRSWSRVDAGWRSAVGVAALLAALAGLTVFATLGAVALVGPFLALAWLALRRDWDVGFEAVLVIAGAGLVLAVEFAYAKVWPHDPNALRWNTVFKVYMQVWVLWGTAAGAALACVLGSAREAVRESAGDVAGLFTPRRRYALAVLVAVILLVNVSVFGALALSNHFDDRLSDSDSVEMTLDATHYVEVHHPDEAAAIDWLNNRSGQPNMVSMPSGDYIYRWVNGPSSLTGVPTLVGWNHEKGYRSEEAYRTRVEDVEAIYQGTWPTTASLLEKYDVRYIYLGPNEREEYGARDFSQYAGISVAFENERVTIYEVSLGETNQSRTTRDLTAPAETVDRSRPPV